MNNLDKFVEVWEKTGDAEDILALGLSLPSAADAQAHISSLAPDAQIRTRDALEAMALALAAHVSGMEEDSRALQAQIDQSIQASNACIAYTKTPKNAKPRR